MGCCNKLALLMLNFAVFAVGVSVVVLASLVLSKSSNYGELLIDGIMTLPVGILVTGIIILLIGFLGCCGAMKENPCMLKTYAAIVLVLFIAEIVMGILIIVYGPKAEELVTDGMSQIFEKYGGEDQALTKSIDAIQHDVHCCGVYNYTDWKNNTHLEEYSVPVGCCITNVTCDGKNILNKPLEEVSQLIYTEGCWPRMKEELQGLTVGLGVMAIILALVQLICINCACGIANQADRNRH